MPYLCYFSHIHHKTRARVVSKRCLPDLEQLKDIPADIVDAIANIKLFAGVGFQKNRDHTIKYLTLPSND